MRLASIVAVALVLPACQLYFTGDDDADDEPCDRPAQEPGYSERLINPDTLACQTFTQSGCDDQCGPCAAGAIYIPPWGACNSPCIGLAEDACIANVQCRVARGYEEYYAPYSSADDFWGCYPIGTGPVPEVESCAGLDAEQCGAQNDCTALYTGAPGGCNGFAPEACIGAQFKECIPEARRDPGECEPAGCRQEPPACPANTTPGVLNGCYTGACIPSNYCGLASN